MVRLNAAWFGVGCLLFLSAVWQWHQLSQTALPEAAYHGKQTLCGEVVSLPQNKRTHSQFIFLAQVLAGSPLAHPARLQSHWYYPKKMLKGGEGVCLQASLKRPHSLLNPGGSDFRQYLFRNHITATASVRRVISPWPPEHTHPILQAREALRAHLLPLLPPGRFGTLLLALIMGDKSGMSTLDRHALQATGTIHLWAISGLHIGLVATVCYAMAHLIWRQFYTLTLLWPSQQVGAVAAVVGAFIYSLLSGFAPPAERAFIMVCVAMGRTLLRKNFCSWQGLVTALVIVLLFDPFALLDGGAWCSFTAVFALMLCQKRHGDKPLWHKSLLSQAYIVTLLSPVCQFFFARISLLGPLLNLLCIPLMSLLVIPVLFFATLISFPLPSLSTWLFGCISEGLAWQMAFFQCLLKHSHGWQEIALPFSALLFAALSLVVPRFQRFALATALCAAILTWPRAPKPGHARVTVLDVGQGLAVALETAHHRMLYDVGPAWHGGADMGRQVILPYLRSRHWHHLSKIVISHEDNDHRGGLESVLAGVKNDLILTSAPQSLGKIPSDACRGGTTWRWDGVEFALLWPEAAGARTPNDRSCVLRVAAGDKRLLLTGDIEHGAEAQLLSQGADVRSDIIVAPHHGSKTSSTEAFVAAVAPKVVVYATGAHNRYRMPHKPVVARYAAHGTRAYNTAGVGAVTIDLGPEQFYIQSEQTKRHNWYGKHFSHR